MRNPSGKLPLLAILLYLTACTKTTVSSNEGESASPANKWNLVTDSTFEGVGLANHPVDYTGEPGDYFSFSTNGHVYTKEGNVLDTLTYQQFSASTIFISDFGIIGNGIPDTSTITGLGTNSLTANNGSDPTPQTIVIESPFAITPGGEFWRKVTLSR
jgi:hypothetical protein